MVARDVLPTREVPAAGQAIYPGYGVLVALIVKPGQIEKFVQTTKADAPFLDARGPQWPQLQLDTQDDAGEPQPADRSGKCVRALER